MLGARPVLLGVAGIPTHSLKPLASWPEYSEASRTRETVLDASRVVDLPRAQGHCAATTLLTLVLALHDIVAGRHRRRTGVERAKTFTLTLAGTVPIRSSPSLTTGSVSPVGALKWWGLRDRLGRGTRLGGPQDPCTVEACQRAPPCAVGSPSPFK